MSNQKMLDLPLRQIFDDRPTLNRVVTALQTDLGVTFLEALEALHQGADSAGANGVSSLRGALDWARSDIDPEDVAASVRVLERRDGAVAAAFEREAGPLLTERVDDRGLVQLDQAGASNGSTYVASGGAGGMASPNRGEPLRSDVGKVLADPQEFERRLARIRVAEPGHFDGDKGRETFRREDRSWAESGKDRVRSAERPREIRQAQAKADRVGARLDRAIAEAGDKRQQLRLLEAEISKLDGPAAGVREFGLGELRKQAADARREPTRLLDQIDASAEAAVSGQVPPSVQLPADGHGLFELVQERMRLLDRDQDQFDQTLAEVLRGDPAPAPAMREPEIPAGLHPGSHAIHEKVEARLRELDLAPNQYLRVLEGMMFPVTVEKGEGGE
jgi:hypothetical protein